MTASRMMGLRVFVHWLPSSVAPSARHLLPEGEGERCAVWCTSSSCSGRGSGVVVRCTPSPPGRRWPEGPDEGLHAPKLSQAHLRDSGAPRCSKNEELSNLGSPGTCRGRYLEGSPRAASRQPRRSA